jgi:small subunit ribosomal protein S20
MPTHRSAAKRMRQNEKLRLRNVAVRSRLRTFLKRTRAAIQAKDQDQIEQLVPETVSHLDDAVSQGVIHWRNAARKKSRIMKQAAAVRSTVAAPSEPTEQAEPTEEATPSEQAER